MMCVLDLTLIYLSTIYLSSTYLPIYLPIYLCIWSYWKATKIVRIWRAIVLKRSAMHKGKLYIWYSFSTQSICWYARLKSLAEICSWMTVKLNRTSGWFTGIGKQKLKFATHQSKGTVMDTPDISLRHFFFHLRFFFYTLGLGVKWK